MPEPLDLDAIRKRAEAATPGPWVRRRDRYVKAQEWVSKDVLTSSGSIVAQTGWTEADVDPADAEFIAHARTDVPALVAEVERLRAERADPPLTDDELGTIACWVRGIEKGVWNPSPGTKLRVADFFVRLVTALGLNDPARR